MNNDAFMALSSALSYVIQARGVLARAQTDLEFVERSQPVLFTRAQAIADAKAKAQQFGYMPRVALFSLIADWEAEDATMKACQQP